MDIRDRVMDDQPNTFLHKIASIVPGYTGYVDRERRRDADKLLRTQLARQYSAQRDRLNRVQQSLVRSRNMEHIAEVDRLAGVLQRFIDRLATATYGYSGLFDPVKVEADELDQLYAFDMSLAGGVDQVSSAIDALESAATSPGADRGELSELPAAISHLSTVLDELNARLNERADLLTSGRKLPGEEYRTLLSSLETRGVGGGGGNEGGGSSRGSGETGGAETRHYGTHSAEPGVLGDTGGGAGGAEGVPTTGLSGMATRAPEPGLSSMAEGSQGLTETTSEVDLRAEGTGSRPETASAGTGIESASSPAAAPGAPGHDLVEGLDMATDLQSTTGTGLGADKPPLGQETQS